MPPDSMPALPYPCRAIIPPPTLADTADMCNALGNLHGGAAATLIDTVSSASNAMLATESFWGIPMLSGVSITLDMQYYNACPV